MIVPAEGAAAQNAAARPAGLIMLAGCCATVLGSSAPWLLKLVLGVSAVTSGISEVVPALVALAVLSALVAGGVLLRRPAPSAVAAGLVFLALAQLGLATWNAVDVLRSIAQYDSRLVADRAVGTGVYLCLLGASITLGAGVLAWTKRASRVETAAPL